MFCALDRMRVGAARSGSDLLFGARPDDGRARAVIGVGARVERCDHRATDGASGWQTGSVALAISNGELDARVDAGGELAIATLAVSVGAIDIPPSVFGKPAQMRDVRLAMTSTSDVATTWSDDDDATVSGRVVLALEWALAVGDSATPLGTQQLSPIAADVTLSGTADDIVATIALDGHGQLWSWAGVLELDDLTLSLAAASDD